MEKAKCPEAWAAPSRAALPWGEAGFPLSSQGLTNLRIASAGKDFLFPLRAKHSDVMFRGCSGGGGVVVVLKRENRSAEEHRRPAQLQGLRCQPSSFRPAASQAAAPGPRASPSHT